VWKLPFFLIYSLQLPRLSQGDAHCPGFAPSLLAHTFFLWVKEECQRPFSSPPFLLSGRPPPFDALFVYFSFTTPRVTARAFQYPPSLPPQSPTQNTPAPNPVCIFQQVVSGCCFYYAFASIPWGQFAQVIFTVFLKLFLADDFFHLHWLLCAMLLFARDPPAVKFAPSVSANFALKVILDPHNPFVTSWPIRLCFNCLTTPAVDPLSFGETCIPPPPLPRSTLVQLSFSFPPR